MSPWGSHPLLRDFPRDFPVRPRVSNPILHTRRFPALASAPLGTRVSSEFAWFLSEAYGVWQVLFQEGFGVK